MSGQESIVESKALYDFEAIQRLMRSIRILRIIKDNPGQRPELPKPVLKSEGVLKGLRLIGLVSDDFTLTEYGLVFLNSGADHLGRNL